MADTAPERLDEVDRAGLTHAYGPADDVPELIRRLLSPDAGVALFAALLGDADAEIAVPAAQALAVFPEHVDRTALALATAAADDEHPSG